MPHHRTALLLTALSIATTFACAAEAGSAEDVSFREYDPPSTLKVPEHPRTRAKYPFIDIHNHQEDMTTQDLATVVQAMDEMKLVGIINPYSRGFRATRD